MVLNPGLPDDVSVALYKHLDSTLRNLSAISGILKA